MRKNSFIKIFGVALAASLIFTGCDSGGSSNPINLEQGGGVAVTGGGGTTAAAATTTGGGTGTTGFGLTGGTLNPGGSGTTSTTTTTGGTAATTTGTTTTTTGTTTGGTGGNNFLNAITGRNFRTGLNNPTAFTAMSVNGIARTFIVDGFRLGQANGRLLVLDETGTFNAATGGFPIIEVQRSQDSTFTAALTNPLDIVSDGTALYISVGFEAAQDGAIIRVSNLTQNGNTITGRFDDITSGVTRPLNPAFMTLVGTGNGNFVYWSEYGASVTGQIRRIRTDGTGTSDTIVNNLNFPAGIDHNGSQLAICDTSGGGQSLGRVILTAIEPATTLNGQDPTDVTEVVTENQTDQAIRRPFDVVSVRGDFFFTEGAALASNAGPISSGQGNGAVRFIDGGTNVAELVSNGLTNCAGIDAIDSNNDGTVAVCFSESVQSTGSLQRRLVNTSNVSLVAPTAVETGLFSPLSVAVLSDTLPAVAGVINYVGGQSNGSLRAWGL